MTKTTGSAAKAVDATDSPEARLKAAVSGGRGPETVGGPEVMPTPVAATSRRRVTPLLAGIAGASLALGAILGAGAALVARPADRTGTMLAEVSAGLEANRLEAARLAGEFDRLGAALSPMQETADAARSEAKTRGTGLIEKITKVEQALTARIAALGERIDQAEKDQAARSAALAALVEKRPASVAAAAKSEPIQTGSIPEAKPKPAIIEAWAVRDVYDGTAMIEDRRHRLVEVAIGSAIPGIGRVDAVERRGREWVVVTRQGLITPQPW